MLTRKKGRGEEKTVKVSFYLGHPAHFHLFKHSIKHLQRWDGAQVLARPKDVLLDLLDAEGIAYTSVSVGERNESWLGRRFQLAKRVLQVLRHVVSFGPDVLMGTSADLAYVGRLIKKPSYVFVEDDHDIIPEFAKLVFPVSDYVVAPKSCRLGPYAKKGIRYNGYHELAYLRPEVFQVDESVISKLKDGQSAYALLRFVGLNAYHDDGVEGLSNDHAKQLVDLLLPHGRVYITSERPLDPTLEPYRIQLHPSDILSAMAGASIFVGDGQTMAIEAGILGTPSVRYNSFVGKIGVLEELDHVHQVTIGVKPNDIDTLFSTVHDLVTRSGIKQEWGRRAERLLDQTDDLNQLILGLIEGKHPTSVLPERSRAAS